MGPQSKPIFERVCWQAAKIWVVDSCTVKCVADVLHIPIKTATNHIQECYKVMGNEEQHCQLGLAKFMVKHGLIKVDELFPSYKVT